MDKQKYWDISTLKKRAKTVLKDSYWLSLGGSVFNVYVPAFVKSIIIRLACIGTVMAEFRQFAAFYNSGRLYRYTVPYMGDRILLFDFDLSTILNDPELWTILITLGTALTSVSLVSLVYKVFVQNLFEIGESRLYTSNRYGNKDFANVFYGFKEHYGHNMWAIFIRNLFLSLWSLLLIIPGIIKSFSYAMVPWIMAENPNLKATRAITISREMMNGEKWRMFWLNLSFIGWYILGTLCFGIGVLFVIPYHRAAVAELYGALRVKAVKEGIVSPSELCAELFTQIPVNHAPQNGFEPSASAAEPEVTEEKYSGLETEDLVAKEVDEVEDKEQPGYADVTAEVKKPDAEKPELKEEPPVSEQEINSAEAQAEEPGDGSVPDATNINF